MEILTDFIFLGSKITVYSDCSHEIRRWLLLGRKAMTNLGSVIKSKDQFANKGTYNQKYGFSRSHVRMWVLDPKESWAPKNWMLVVLEKTLESPLGCKDIKPVSPKGHQSWIFIGRNDAGAEAPILWPPEEQTHWKTFWYWERLKARWEGGSRGWDGYTASLNQWTGVHLRKFRKQWFWENSGKIVKDKHAWCTAIHAVTKSQTGLSNWTRAKQDLNAKDKTIVFLKESLKQKNVSITFRKKKTFLSRIQKAGTI